MLNATEMKALALKAVMSDGRFFDGSPVDFDCDAADFVAVNERGFVSFVRILPSGDGICHLPPIEVSAAWHRRARAEYQKENGGKINSCLVILRVSVRDDGSCEIVRTWTRRLR